MIKTVYFVYFKRSCIALISTIFIFSLGFSLYAQTYDVSIGVTPMKIANPGELVTHVFTIKNQGTSADTYNLTLNLPKDWTSLPIPDQVTVSPGGTKPVFANVNVPNNAESREYNIELTAQSTANPSIEATKAASIRVKSVPGFDIEWVSEPAGIGPGVTAEAKFKIINTGNLPDRYNIEISQPRDWTFTIDEERVQIMPGQSRTLSVTFTAPKDIRVDSRYRIEITVTSEHDRKLEETIETSGQLVPPPPEKVEKSLFPTWDLATSMGVTQAGDPSFSVSGNGDIPRLGEVSAGLNLSVEGFQGGSLQVMRDKWGFALNGASISGSYLGVSGSPLIMGEFADITSRFIFSKESKGISLEKEGEYWELRAVLGSDNTKRRLEFHELQGAYEFSNGVVLDGLITSASTQTQSGTIVEAGLEMSSEKVEIYPFFMKVYPDYPTQAPGVAAGVDIGYEEDEFISFFNWDYNKTRRGEAPNYYHSQEHDFDVGTSLDLGDYLDSNFSLGFTFRKSDDDPVSNDLYANSFSAGISGGDTLTWFLGTDYSRTEDYVSDTVVSTHSVDGSLSYSLGDTEHSIAVSLSRTEGPSGTSMSNSFTLSSSFTDVPLSPSFSLSRGSEDTTISASFSEESAEGLDLSISFSASLVKQDSVSLSISASFPDPFRYCGPTKGRVTGHVFIDENQNGKKDEGEREIQGGILTLNEEKAISGATGDFAFPPVQPGSYRLDVEKAKAGFDPTVKLPLEVSVSAGET
ncbi:hypothetical protein KGY71_07055, partial [Candidatus Bipolaricaulota bacterium]|nr:hypothetical protein [Candidatus Bipolaricaulota bacterium]